MFNVTKLLNNLVQPTQPDAAVLPSANAILSQQKAGIGGLLNNPALTGTLAGVGGGLLTGLMLNNKKTRLVGGGIGAAALGGIAFTAFQKWQAKKNLPQNAQTQNLVEQQPQTQAWQGAALDFDAMPVAQQEEHSRIMLSAIIAAAKANGVFDERERKLIRDETEKLNDPEAMAWVQQEINKPLDIASVAGLAQSPEMAAEIYLTTYLFIDRQNELDMKYLNSLANEMKLDPQLRMEIEQQVSA